MWQIDFTAAFSAPLNIQYFLLLENKRVLSLAFRVRSMVQLNIQPLSMGWLLLYCKAVSGAVKKSNRACGPLLELMVLCNQLVQTQPLSSGAPGKQQN